MKYLILKYYLNCRIVSYVMMIYFHDLMCKYNDKFNVNKNLYNSKISME